MIKYSIILLHIRPTCIEQPLLSVNAHLNIGQFLVEHLHLGPDVVPLLVLIEGAIVPLQELQRWVEGADIVGASDPRVLGVGGHAIPTMGIAGSNNEHIVRYGLGEIKTTRILVLTEEKVECS